MTDQSLFRMNDKAKAVISSLETFKESPASAEFGYTAQDVELAIKALENRPLIRFFVMRKINQEMRAQGINWDAIGDFLVKIAPIILEIIKMFL